MPARKVPGMRSNGRIDAELVDVGYVIPYLSQTVHDVSGKVHVTQDQVLISGI